MADSIYLKARSAKDGGGNENNLRLADSLTAAMVLALLL